MSFPGSSSPGNGHCVPSMAIPGASCNKLLSSVLASAVCHPAATVRPSLNPKAALILHYLRLTASNQPLLFIGVGFGTNLNNKIGLFTPLGHFSRRVRQGKSCCCVHLSTGKESLPQEGWGTGVCLEQLSWIPGEKWIEAVYSSQEKALPALSPRRKPELPSPLEKLLRAQIRTAKAASELPLSTWLSSLPSLQGGNFQQLVAI